MLKKMLESCIRFGSLMSLLKYFCILATVFNTRFAKCATSRLSTKYVLTNLLIATDGFHRVRPSLPLSVRIEDERPRVAKDVFLNVGRNVVRNVF